MLKSLLLQTLFIGIINSTFSQETRRNNNWVLGYGPLIQFNFDNSLSLSKVTDSALLFESSNISDTSGELLFLSTGFVLADSDAHLILNGENINCPYGNILSDAYGGGGKSPQTSLILPKKGNTYYVFSTGMSDSLASILINNAVYLGYDVLNYSVVDMDSNGGQGKVTEKNKIILDNQRYATCALTACRHGNGKDWWLVKADCWKHQYQIFQVTADTIVGPFYYTIPDTANYCSDYCEIYFSDDGSKFASNIYRQINSTSGLGLYNRVDVYDFDRCIGQFTYRNHYEVPNDTTTYPYEDGVTGISFSPNSKLLYMMNLYSVYQIDINDTNRFNGIFIHGPDDSISAFPLYYISKCAPDNKLYIGNFNGTRNTMSYIDSPNVRGLGCTFVPKGLTQSFNNNLLWPPNMPNYGLGMAPVGGNCWPLAIEQLDNESIRQLEVYPNPANDRFFIKTESKKERELYNSIGQLLLTTFKNEIDVSEMARGIYYLKVGNAVKKVVIE